MLWRPWARQRRPRCCWTSRGDLHERDAWVLGGPGFTDRPDLTEHRVCRRGWSMCRWNTSSARSTCWPRTPASTAGSRSLAIRGGGEEHCSSRARRAGRRGLQRRRQRPGRRRDRLPPAVLSPLIASWTLASQPLPYRHIRWTPSCAASSSRARPSRWCGVPVAACRFRRAGQRQHSGRQRPRPVLLLPAADDQNWPSATYSRSPPTVCPATCTRSSTASSPAPATRLPASRSRLHGHPIPRSWRNFELDSTAEANTAAPRPSAGPAPSTFLRAADTGNRTLASTSTRPSRVAIWTKSR